SLSRGQTLGDGSFCIQPDNFVAWTHHLARVPLPQPESIQCDVLSQRWTVGVTARLAEDQADLFFGMDQLGFADGLKSTASQQPEGGVVEKPDDRIEKFIKPL